MSFQDKTVLVTGSTSGIGRAAAEQFGQRGAHVIVTGRDQTRGSDVVDAIEAHGGTAQFIAADLSTPDGPRKLAAAVERVDVLVNNAGIFPFGASHEIPIDEVRAVFDFNVIAPFALVAAFVPGMVERGGGAIVNVSTMVASFGNPGMSAYGASKAALELLTKAWAAEYGQPGCASTPCPPDRPARLASHRLAISSTSSLEPCRCGGRPTQRRSLTRSSISPPTTRASSPVPSCRRTEAGSRSKSWSQARRVGSPP